MCCPTCCPFQPFQPFQVYCFAGDMQVETLNGSKKRMDEIEIGDWIKSIYDSEVTLF
jgi:hypothetical protein